jgi:hypothetical protein
MLVICSCLPDFHIFWFWVDRQNVKGWSAGDLARVGVGPHFLR